MSIHTHGLFASRVCAEGHNQVGSLARVRSIQQGQLKGPLPGHVFAQAKRAGACQHAGIDSPGQPGFHEVSTRRVQREPPDAKQYGQGNGDQCDDSSPFVSHGVQKTALEYRVSGTVAFISARSGVLRLGT